MSINYTPRTWVVSELVTAAEMNTEIRDALTGIQAAWTSYTPALTASTTNPTLGSGSSVAGGYLQLGKTFMGFAEIVFGTSGVVVGSGFYAVSLPVAMVAAAATAGRIVGTGLYFDSSAAGAAAWFELAMVAFTSTTCRANIQGFNTMSNVSPVIPAASDQIRIQFMAQAA